MMGSSSERSMPVSPISKLLHSEQQVLLDDLNYLNTAEIKSFCKQHSIPYAIAIARWELVHTELGRRLSRSR
jgi:hypothetical protein